MDVSGDAIRSFWRKNYEVVVNDRTIGYTDQVQITQLEGERKIEFEIAAFPESLTSALMEKYFAAKGGTFYQIDGRDFVVRESYLDLPGRYVSVIDLGKLTTMAIREGLEFDSPSCKAATRWFNEHPHPKPWHNAKPGEVWMLTIDGQNGTEWPFTVTDYDTFESLYAEYDLDGEEIENARLIWSPENDNG